MTVKITFEGISDIMLQFIKEKGIDMEKPVSINVMQYFAYAGLFGQVAAMISNVQQEEHEKQEKYN